MTKKRKIINIVITAILMVAVCVILFSMIGAAVFLGPLLAGVFTKK